jgi:transcriptional regulator with XRE-family HTH domain
MRMVSAMRISGKAVERLRWKHGLTREQLAAKAGVSAATVQRVETGVTAGNPPLAAALAKAFDVDVFDLTFEDDEREAVS